MTLSEIETILEELAVRHHNLNTELLTTLLTASGWEDKNVKEALTLFKQKGSTKQAVTQTPISPVVSQASVVVPVLENKDEITFYQPDGSEEKELVGFVETPSVARDEEVAHIPKEIVEEAQSVPIIPKVLESVVVPLSEVPEIKKVAPPQVVSLQKFKDIESLVGERKEDMVVTEKNNEEKGVVPTPAFKELEPQSLLVPPSPVLNRSRNKESEIPDDLPLLPFESSPHVWSFSRYKDVFHSEDPVTLMKIAPEHKENVVKAEPLQPVVIVTKKEDNEEISVEKVPLSKGDQPLVFLAAVMLLVIILILGYMYSNGRL